MMEKQPTTKDVWKNDQWVRPFLKRYKNLVFCLTFRLLDVL